MVNLRHAPRRNRTWREHCMVNVNDAQVIQMCIARLRVTRRCFLTFLHILYICGHSWGSVGRWWKCFENSFHDHHNTSTITEARERILEPEKQWKAEEKMKRGQKRAHLGLKRIRYTNLVTRRAVMRRVGKRRFCSRCVSRPVGGTQLRSSQGLLLLLCIYIYIYMCVCVCV